MVQDIERNDCVETRKLDLFRQIAGIDYAIDTGSVHTITSHDVRGNYAEETSPGADIENARPVLPHAGA